MTLVEQLNELKQKAEQIRGSCAGWLRCQDGSYECALHYAGYDAVCEKIREVEELIQIEAHEENQSFYNNFG